MEAPKKRSLFKRPVWAQSTATAKSQSPDTPSASLFDRSETFDLTVAERDRRRREKTDRKKDKEEKRRSAGDAEGQNSPEVDLNSSGKRRRISDVDDGLPAAPATHINSHKIPAGDEELPSQRYDNVPTAIKSGTPTRQSRRDKTVVIELESDADDDNDDFAPLTYSTSQDNLIKSPIVPTLPVRSDRSPLPIEEDSESDAELAEIKREARQKQRREEQEEKDRAKVAQNYDNHGSGYADNYPTPPPVTDPTIQLFVTSPIPNTAPLIVSRKLSQRLQEVKEAWCGRQNFGPEILPSHIFFTYRLRKLYDVTTCKSLGLKLNSDGRILPDDRAWADEDETGLGGLHEGKVHLEAVTEELYNKMREAKRNVRNGSHLHSRSGIGGPSGLGIPMETEESTSEPEPVIKLVMKARGFKDVKLKVKPSTQFAKMEHAARRMFGEQKAIPAEQTIVLAFDGETLEPPTGMVKDTDIEDLDSIEIYFK